MTSGKNNGGRALVGDSVGGWAHGDGLPWRRSIETKLRISLEDSWEWLKHGQGKLGLTIVVVTFGDEEDGAGTTTRCTRAKSSYGFG